ncbi:MAG: PEP-CTERM sorting domain-containing protein [Verrucomicrobiota bacterium]
MKTSPFLLSALALTVATKLHAATAVQTVNFDFTETYDVGESSFEHVDSAFFTGTFAPFDPSLGTLESYAFNLDLTVGVDGVLGDAGGSVSLALGGTFFFAGISSGGTGESFGDGGPPGAPISFSVPLTLGNTFLVSDANVTYDPAILTAATGGDAFTMRYGSPVTITVYGGATFDVTTVATLTLTYEYTPVAVPEPSSYAAIFGGLALTGAVVRRRRRA